MAVSPQLRRAAAGPAFRRHRTIFCPTGLPRGHTMAFKTEQEQFWAGDFGLEYQKRCQGERLISSNVALFSRILGAAPGVKSVLELGCNIGNNLVALNRINCELELAAYEINETAAARARELKVANVVCDTVLNPIPATRTYDLTFTKGVLIHINPDALHQVYDNLVALSNRYVMVSEYYNPTPVTVNYRGNDDRLFKRDFAGELMDRHQLRLVDYGFVYHRDRTFPLDDSTWFLLEK
jgi:pseudaminic acid biosynthesis-associated methylase